MGFDEENLEPKPRKLTKKKDQELKTHQQVEYEYQNMPSKPQKPHQPLQPPVVIHPAQKPSFCVIYEQDKRELLASNVDELVKNIKEKFKIEIDAADNDTETSSLRLEYWSNLYQEWLLLELLPENNSKIRVTIQQKLKINQEIKPLEKDENSKEAEYEEAENLETPNFIKNFNLTFKKYLALDESELSQMDAEHLRHFETAVIFIMKRHGTQLVGAVATNANSDETKMKLLLDDSIKQLNEEIKQFKTSTKQLKLQVDQLDEKISQIEKKQQKTSSPLPDTGFKFNFIKKKDKKSKGNFCIIC